MQRRMRDERDSQRRRSGFPAAGDGWPNDDLYPAYPGMTMRDWFAGQALAGIIRDRREKGFATEGAEAGDWMAVQAYGIADAMLAERSKP